MIVYKNFNPEDFEKINHGTSLLNNIFNNLNLMTNEIYNNQFKKTENKIKNLNKEKQSLIQFVEYDIESILGNEYTSQMSKYNVNSFIVEGKSYNRNQYQDFYKEILTLYEDEQVVDVMRSHSRRAEDITHFLKSENRGRDLIPLIKSLKQGYNLPSIRVQEISNEIIVLEHVLQSLKYNKDRYTSGEIIDKFMKIHIETIGNEDDYMRNIADENEQKAYKLQEKIGLLNDIDLTLLINNYISYDFLHYISPVEYSSNENDAEFIRKVLRRFEFTTDQRLTNSDHVLSIFQNRGIIRPYLYSSDIVTLDIEHELRFIILSKVTSNNDYEFMYNVFVNKRLKNKTLQDIFEYLILSQSDFFRKFIIKYSSNLAFMVDSFDNKEIVNSIVGEEVNVKVNDLLSRIDDETILYDIYLFLDQSQHIPVQVLSDGLKTKSGIESFIRSNKNRLKSEESLANFILKYNLINDEEDYIYLKGLYNLPSFFEAYMKKFKDINIVKVNVKLFSKYIIGEYITGAQETLESFNLFLDYVLSMDLPGETLFNKISEVVSQKDVFQSYKNIVFKNLKKDDISKVLKKINFIGMIKDEIIMKSDVIELIKNKKVNFSYENFKKITDYFDYSEKIIDVFLKYAYDNEKILLFKEYENISDLISINSKLKLFLECGNTNEKVEVLNSINCDIDSIDYEILNESTFNQMLKIGLNKTQLINIMRYSESKQIRSAGLKYILDNEDLSVNSKELDKALNIEFFETATKQGNIPHNFDQGIEIEYIKFLSEKGYAALNENDESKFYVYKKFLERFPDS